jgi:hypothetical protein
MYPALLRCGGAASVVEYPLDAAQRCRVQECDATEAKCIFCCRSHNKTFVSKNLFLLFVAQFYLVVSFADSVVYTQYTFAALKLFL